MATPQPCAFSVGSERKDNPAALAKRAEVEFAAGLETDDEEEEGHQARADELTESEFDAGVAHLNREFRSPERLVASAAGVGPDQRGDDRKDQER
jgi:hypothetical protein